VLFSADDARLICLTTTGSASNEQLSTVLGDGEGPVWLSRIAAEDLLWQVCQLRHDARVRRTRRALSAALRSR
jgi:hypothetical protein